MDLLFDDTGGVRIMCCTSIYMYHAGNGGVPGKLAHWSVVDRGTSQ